eukprot:CAMPEP_0174746410 /NCGR_PEP_ID=MMETSP1094-20130205/88991_1 /TAXON_ID=156173 /ORGANISM="Chrysochromulina brevifilum, Strain UTEX LB 985" /LENGTH=234 /DNA_ID=CAMNT_0015951109 /DNA_START=366 /DNA_END=1069 /DNA_ORIENTATION=+
MTRTWLLQDRGHCVCMRHHVCAISRQHMCGHARGDTRRGALWWLRAQCGGAQHNARPGAETGALKSLTLSHVSVAGSVALDGRQPHAAREAADHVELAVECRRCMREAVSGAWARPLPTGQWRGRSARLTVWRGRQASSARAVELPVDHRHRVAIACHEHGREVVLPAQIQPPCIKAFHARSRLGTEASIGRIRARASTDVEVVANRSGGGAVARKMQRGRRRHRVPLRLGTVA